MSDLKKIFIFFTSTKTSDLLRKKFWSWLISAEYKEDKDVILKEIWNEPIPDFDQKTEDSLLIVKRKLGHQRPKFATSYKQLLRIASIILLFFSVAILFRYYLPKDVNEIVEHVVPAGHRHKLELADGTKVHLNAGSIFVYPKSFTGSSRVVYLFGEGNFEVFPNKDKPFIVKTPQLAIKALGTKFNVSAYSDMNNIIATLEEGSIEVRSIVDSTQAIILKPNEQLRYNYVNQLFVLSNVNAQNANKWIDGELYFANQPLSEIISTLHRTYNINLTIDPQVQATDLYTLRLNRGESLRKVLHILELTVGNINVHISKDGKSAYIEPKN